MKVSDLFQALVALKQPGPETDHSSAATEQEARVGSRAVLGAQKKRKLSRTCQQHNHDSSEVQPTAHSSVSQTFLLAGPLSLRKITTDAYISAPVNIECPDVRYPKLKMAYLGTVFKITTNIYQ